MSDEFRAQRRQQFITADFAESQLARRVRMRGAFAEELQSPETDAEGASLLTFSAAEYEFEHLLLGYTAGQPIESLRSELTDVVAAYERYQTALGAFEQAPQMSPLGLDQLADYERALQLISLCILLHRTDLLPRIAALIDPGYRGEDTLYEDLLAYFMPNRVELDEWYHEEPYTPLIHAMYAEEPRAATAELADYCRRWYPAFKYVPWHNGHLRINGTEGDYFGYWAFEAGAVALLCDIDDSAIDHMVYPRDLVAWARANKHLSEPDETGANRLRCEGGQPCPQAGYWSTPAQVNSRRRFDAGELMPIIEGSAWGATVWYWEDA